MAITFVEVPAVVSDTASSSSVDIDGTPSGRSGTSQSSFSSRDEAASGPTVTDPSVVVGMACRLPGATNTSQLWKVLEEKRDLQRKMPEDRFNVDNFFHPLGANKGTVWSRIPH
jgi:hypothetical protein